MRNERDRRRAAQGRELLFDLRAVPVPLCLVGERVLIHRHVVHGVPHPTGSGHALLRVDHDVREQAALGQRGQGKHAGGRVAARRRHDLRLPQLVAVELGQPVNGPLQQRGRSVLAVPPLVGGQVAQPEVGGEVDDEHAEVPKGGDGRRRGPVRIGHDRGVDPAERVRGPAPAARGAPGSGGRGSRAACRHRSATSPPRAPAAGAARRSGRPALP